MVVVAFDVVDVVLVVMVAVVVIVCGVPSSVMLVTIVVVVEISLFSAKKRVRVGMVTMARPAKIKKMTVAIPIFSIGPMFQDFKNAGSSLSVVEMVGANDSTLLNLVEMHTVTNCTNMEGCKNPEKVVLQIPGQPEPNLSHMGLFMR